MTLVFTIVMLAAANGAIPYGVWGYGAHYLNISEKEFIARYRLVSFPRIICAALVCLTIGVGPMLPEAKVWLDWTGLIFMMIFSGMAVFDALKATRGCWINGERSSGRGS